MEFYLVHHGETDAHSAPDPYSARLSPTGRAQAQAIAQRCSESEIALLCASPLPRAQETADAIIEAQAGLPERWDLKALEDLNMDDLMGDPTATHLVSTWRPDQIEQGLGRLWSRVSAALARIQIYAQEHGLDPICIVAGERVLSLLLSHWYSESGKAPLEDTSPSPGTVFRVEVAKDGEIGVHRLQVSKEKGKRS